MLRNVECICGKGKGGLIKVPLSRIGYKSLEVHSVERGINCIYICNLRKFISLFRQAFCVFITRLNHVDSPVQF